ncbi:MAG TPA: serine protein kinase [Bacteroidales bacterium]|nr:MAG: hypothetical protein A2W98_04155 [Bacteroidetes bacterium GWF2_33_38]OFY89073.1 MAG: hypothetical protein A2236_10985 [Bacteroidetes bacterium RIFOXYA2_FULL_33_7]HBF87973.1 serine protein kinase [Bacteroidales bacterium]
MKRKNNIKPTIDIVQDKARKLEALIDISNELREKEQRRAITFNDFLFLISENPEIIFRNIFQQFHDMVKYYVGEGKDDYVVSNDSIGFVKYDCSDLFITKCDNPFFADRLFANRFMNLINGFKKGVQSNRIYLFEGPPGSGKSTFLNNLLNKFEDYSKTTEGAAYTMHWKLDIEKLGGFDFYEDRLNRIAEESDNDDFGKQLLALPFQKKYQQKCLEITCPNNDHPILIIPKEYREKFLEELIDDKSFLRRLKYDKEFEWVLKGNACSICSSIYNTLLDKIGNPLDVYNMMYARKQVFSRQFGKGISVYNPGDQRTVRPITNPTLQNLINELLKTDEIKYVYSDLAFTNNGILALMDIKESNVDRLKSLHGIISDGVHKVEFVEEHINSLFVGIVNPEDKSHYENIRSFKDRVITVNVPYILDYKTESAIYKNNIGKEINKVFLPRILDNFSKIIISTRLDKDTKTIKSWINHEKYNRHIDKDMLLLKMEIYSGKIPDWIGEDDLKNFTKERRKNIIEESEVEGSKGYSGRQSLNIFNSFYLEYSKENKLITMKNVKDFFAESKDFSNEEIPEGFIDSLEHLYNFNILQEVKEAIYYFNEKQISTDVLNYLYCINFEIGDTVKCEYTGDVIKLEEDFFKNLEAIFIGSTSTIKERKSFRNDTMNEYVTRTLSQEIRVNNLKIHETDQYKNLFEKYVNSLKENALAPFVVNENFRRAIAAYDTLAFNTYDSRLKRDIERLIKNMMKKFGYSKVGAKQIGLYVLDNKLAEKY